MQRETEVILMFIMAVALLLVIMVSVLRHSDTEKELQKCEERYERLDSQTTQ